MSVHEEFMLIALGLARDAGLNGEAPVGCVVVDSNGDIIGRGRNRRERSKNAVAHAEIEAISEACGAIGDWRLTGCSLYVTLEPCPMCAGAIIMSRIDKVFFGSRDELTGSCGSVVNLFMEPYNQKTQITGGIFEKECADLLSEFFVQVRKRKG